MSAAEEAARQLALCSVLSAIWSHDCSCRLVPSKMAFRSSYDTLSPTRQYRMVGGTTGVQDREYIAWVAGYEMKASGACLRPENGRISLHGLL